MKIARLFLPEDRRLLLPFSLSAERGVELVFFLLSLSFWCERGIRDHFFFPLSTCRLMAISPFFFLCKEASSALGHSRQWKNRSLPSLPVYSFFLGAPTQIAFFFHIASSGKDLHSLSLSTQFKLRESGIPTSFLSHSDHYFPLLRHPEHPATNFPLLFLARNGKK